MIGHWHRGSGFGRCCGEHESHCSDRPPDLLDRRLHNVLGLLFGFGLAKLLGLNLADQKGISIKVGMQNSGLGASLAMAHFSPIAAVPSTIFSVWRNISGPLLATWWGKRSDHERESDKRSSVA